MYCRARRSREFQILSVSEFFKIRGLSKNEGWLADHHRLILPIPFSTANCGQRFVRITVKVRSFVRLVSYGELRTVS